jgi:hypothetical protein
MSNYENVRSLIEHLPVAVSPDSRDVKWMTDASVVGAARDTDGRVELFLRGPEIKPTSSVIRDAIEYRLVHRDEQPPFEANRLLLPGFGHFDQVAAFIGTELLRSGADSSLLSAFGQTEPIIELAIERLRLSYQSTIGLIGELLLIDALARRAADAELARIFAGWDGWRMSSRDLRIGDTGIEVKTTTRSSSSHLIEGLHQVERSDGSDGSTAEEHLFVVSIGLTAATEGGNSFAMPELVDRIVQRMLAAKLPASEVEKFVFRISEYGATSGGGYDHHTQSSDAPYSMRFVTTFFRAYDMTDDAVRVLRSHDLVAYPHTDAASVRYRIDLPISVSAGNPVSGANQAAGLIIG